MDKNVKELCEQILANQAVLYKMLREIQDSSKSKATPADWILNELNEKAQAFRNLQ